MFSLSSTETFFYAIAISATVVLLIQTILSFVGLGDSDVDFSDDFDAVDGLDFDGDVELDVDVDDLGDVEFNDVDNDVGIDHAAGVKFFTLRGMVAFFSIFGWVGVMLIRQTDVIFTLLVAAAAGFVAMAIISYLFYGMTKLQSSGNISYLSAKGKPAEVYLRIPAERLGEGKIVVTLHEHLTEMAAVTDDKAAIASGDPVVVIDVLSDHVALVKRRH